ncbi:MAG TPA: methyltransferase domain-containing protein [Acidimicrobiales bacterium]
MTAKRTPNAETIRWWVQMEGPHYAADAGRYDDLLSAFDDALFDAADLRPGERVLDVGCGTGGTTIEASTRVRPGGAVVGIDVSPPMLALARERAESAGAAEAEFVEADAQVHAFDAGSFDVVMSRNGLMFFDDPNTAFANLARALRPGGRLAFVAPEGPDRSEWIMVAGIAAAPHIGIPQGLGPNTPGPYGLADPDRTRSILDEAGFTDIRIEALTRSMRIGANIGDAIEFIRTMPRVADLLAAAPTAEQHAALEAVRDALAPYLSEAGVVMHDNGEWLVTATR